MKPEIRNAAHGSSSGRLHAQRGQAMTEYVVVCLLVAILFFVPFEGKPLYMWVIDALRTMHKGYMAGVSVYAYPF